MRRLKKNDILENIVNELQIDMIKHQQPKAWGVRAYF
jgi:hypothetical protein